MKSRVLQVSRDFVTTVSKRWGMVLTVSVLALIGAYIGYLNLAEREYRDTANNFLLEQNYKVTKSRTYLSVTSIFCRPSEVSTSFIAVDGLGQERRGVVCTDRIQKTPRVSVETLSPAPIAVTP